LVFRARVFRVSLCRFLQSFLGVLVVSLFQISEFQEVGGVGEGWLRNRLVQIGDCALIVLLLRVQPAEVVADAGSLAHLAANRFQFVARFGEAARLEKGQSPTGIARASPVSDRLSMQRESFPPRRHSGPASALRNPSLGEPPRIHWLPTSGKTGAGWRSGRTTWWSEGAPGARKDLFARDPTLVRPPC
jgi:hypothetical protein